MSVNNLPVQMDLLARVFDETREAMCVFDRPGRVLFDNAAFRALAGRVGAPPAPDGEANVIGLFCPRTDGFDEARQVVSQIFSGELPRAAVEGVVRTVAGEVFLEARFSPVKDADGAVTAVFATMNDITQSKAAEAVLRKRERDYHHAQRLAQMAFWEWDVRKDRVIWSEGMFEIRQMPSDGFDGRFVSFLSMIHPDDQERVAQAVRQGLRTGVYDIEYRLITANGDLRHVRSVGESVYSTDGEPTGMFGAAQDVTDLKLTEDRLATTEKLTMTGQLAAGVAHEIRNPLTSLKGFLELLPRAAPTVRERYTQIMSDELSRIDRIVSELLVLGKPSHETRLEPGNVHAKLRDCVLLLDAEARLHGVQIDLRCSGDDPLVWCDRDQMKQVFINVIKNSIDAMPRGGKLEILADAQRDRVSVRFRDDGEGMSAEELASLGTPYFTTKQGGTGLGWLVCQNIIAAHKGRLNVTSELGEGTTVQIDLPKISGLRSNQEVPTAASFDAARRTWRTGSAAPGTSV